jgi:hypothetical protein
LQGIGTGNDDDIGAETGTSGGGSADPRREGGDIDKLFAEKMAASFCGHLVFNMQTCYTGEDISLNLEGVSRKRKKSCFGYETCRACNHGRTTKAGVGIGDDGNRTVQGCNHGGVADHVIGSGQAKIGHT